MTRRELFENINAFLLNLADHSPLDQSASIEAKSELMLSATASSKRFATLSDSPQRLSSYRPYSSWHEYSSNAVRQGIQDSRQSKENVQASHPPCSDNFGVKYKGPLCTFAGNQSFNFWHLRSIATHLNVLAEQIEILPFRQFGDTTSFKSHTLADGFQLFCERPIAVQSSAQILIDLGQIIQSVKPDANESLIYRHHFKTGGVRFSQAVSLNVYGLNKPRLKFTKVPFQLTNLLLYIRSNFQVSSRLKTVTTSFMLQTHKFVFCGLDHPLLDIVPAIMSLYHYKQLIFFKTFAIKTTYQRLAVIAKSVSANLGALLRSVRPGLLRRSTCSLLGSSKTFSGLCCTFSKRRL